MKPIFTALLSSAVWIISLLFCYPAAAQTVGDASIGLRAPYIHCTDRQDNDISASLFQCTADEYKYQDGRLNQVYQRLVNTLDKTGKQQLRQEERAWLAIRKIYCDPGVKPDRVAQIKAQTCNVYETAKRATELEYFERHRTQNPLSTGKE